MTENENTERLETKAMNSRDISQASNPDLRASLTALRRASQMARKLAIETDTGIVVVRDGRTVQISADTLRREANTNRNPAQ